MALTTYMLGINVLSFALYGQDKLAAKGWLPLFGRIPEALLHQVELIGGSAGAFLAQRVFRHKISKKPYQQIFSHILILQMAAGAAWAYFRGPSWAVASSAAATTAMLAATFMRLRYIDNWLNRLDGKGGVMPWQRPVTSSPVRRRQPSHTAEARSRR